MTRRIKAGRTVPPDFLKRLDEHVLELWMEVRVEVDGANLEWRMSYCGDKPEVDVEGFHKDMFNSFLGVCSTNPRLAWSVVESVCLGDMGRTDVISFTKNGIPEGKACTEVVGVETLYPLSLTVLGWETVMMHRTSTVSYTHLTLPTIYSV